MASDPDTVSIDSLPEDVIILISLEQEVLTCVKNLVAVAIQFFFSRKTAAFGTSFVNPMKIIPDFC